MSAASWRDVTAFKRFRELQQRADEMFRLLEEIGNQVMADDGNAEGLQPKCVAALRLWNEYRSYAAEAGDEQEPEVQITQLVLESGAAGFSPFEIRRLQAAEGWPCE